MGNFSRDTFDKLKHYVGVRLQQGVPLIDADWNEMEDIKKFELRSFLKWFVGSGVPEGNDGFHTLPAAGGGVGNIVLTSNTGETGLSSIVINLADSTAAGVLGFTAGNASASRIGSSPPRLIGNLAGPFTLEDGMILAVSADGSAEENVVFNEGDDFDDISQAAAEEVVSVINHAVNNLTASIGSGNDFIINGGTAGKPGRCLADGWDVIIENSIAYSQQPLYENDYLAQKWDVEPLKPLSPPPAGERTDMVYLDVWEREVDSEEDDDLVNPGIGIETCVRLKREWVVRRAEGLADKEGLPAYLENNPVFRAGHVYYPLAFLKRSAGINALQQEDIIDLRLTGLAVISQNDVKQITSDMYGPSYALDHAGQPELKLSLREAVNALLRGTLPGTPPQQLTSDTNPEFFQWVLEDRHGDTWMFWRKMKDPLVQNIWYSRFVNGRWGENTQLTTTGSDNNTFVLEDRSGEIWVFWQSNRLIKTHIWYKRCHHENGQWQWEDEKQLTEEKQNVNYNYPFALEDRNGGIWVFWQSITSDARMITVQNIWYNRFNPVSGEWEGEKVLPPPLPANYDKPFALEDRNGNIWVFYTRSIRGIVVNSDIWYSRFVNGSWEDSKQLTTDTAADVNPFALEDRNGDIWVFWQSPRSSSNNDIWYNRWSQSRNIWEGDTQLTTGTDGHSNPFTLEDRNGDIWVFWQSSGLRSSDIRYSRFVNGRWVENMPLTSDTGVDMYPFALEDRSGAIRVLWTSSRAGNYDVWHRSLMPQI